MKKLALFISLALFTGCGETNSDEPPVSETLSEAGAPTILSKPQNCPSSVKYCASFRDVAGVHTFFVQQSTHDARIYDAIEEEETVFQSISLRAGVLNDEGEVWALEDEQDSCRGNSAAKFLKSSFDISDLDGDGLAEVVFAYDLECRENVAPSEMRVVLVEGRTQYLVKGKKFALVDEEGNAAEEPVELSIGKAFAMAPTTFLASAIALWNRHLYDKYYGPFNGQKRFLAKQVVKKVEAKAEAFWQAPQ